MHCAAPCKKITTRISSDSTCVSHDLIWVCAGQIREAGGAAERSNRAAPERDDQPETGTGQYGGEGGLSVLRTGQRHTGSESLKVQSPSENYIMIDNRFLNDLFIQRFTLPTERYWV